VGIAGKTTEQNRPRQGIIPGGVGPKLVYIVIADHSPNWLRLALSYNPKSVTGIDIDEDLLDHARSHLSFRYSRLYPTLAASQMNPSQDAYPSQSAHPKEKHKRVNYFPISSIQGHGHLPYAERVSGREDSQDGNKEREGVIPSFPLNVTFRKEDWGAFSMHEDTTYKSRVRVPKEEYNVILALSVIKWLHLEHGDNGRCTSAFLPLCITAVTLATENSFQPHLPSLHKAWRNAKQRLIIPWLRSSHLLRQLSPGSPA